MQDDIKLIKNVWNDILDREFKNVISHGEWKALYECEWDQQNPLTYDELKRIIKQMKDDHPEYFRLLELRNKYEFDMGLSRRWFSDYS